MITKKVALKVLNAALSTGGDYAEIYLEENFSQNISVDNGCVEKIAKNETYGAGIRILNGFQSVYGYTSTLTEKKLLALAETLAKKFNEPRKITVNDIERQRVKNINKIKRHLLDVPTEDIINYLKETNSLIASYDKRIVRSITSFANNKKNIVIFSSEGETGKEFHNTEERGRAFFFAYASNGEKITTGMSNIARYDGWDYFTKKVDYKKVALQAAEKAIQMLSAKECPSGRYPVVIKNGWGGVLFHEACGHSLEATATAKKLSVFSDSIGKQIASPLVTAYDDGTLSNYWGSNNIDSEGHVTQKNLLIKDGICCGFLVDKFNARRLNMPANGTSRRQSYKYEPTSRMSNTYIAAGKDNPADIIKDTKLGIYVADFGGGSVQPSTGEFNFSASEAYIIRDGKICEPVSGCTLIGSGKEVLMNIDRVGTDVAQGSGNCGSVSGSVPVNVGQPTIRVKEMTVGGRGGKLE